MKILHIAPTYFPAHRQGGPIKSVHELNKELTKLGIDIAVYTTNMDVSGILNVPFDQKVDVDGVKIWYFPITFRPWEYSYALHRTLAKNAKNFDLIHITSVFLSASTLGAYYAKKFKKPYVISPRGNFMREPLKFKSFKKRIYINLIEQKNLAGANAIHFTAEKEKDDYLELDLPAKKTIVIPNGIDVKNYENSKKGNFRKKFGISKNKKMILFIGRLHPIKGLDTLIPAFTEVVKKEPKAILVLAGSDNDGYKKTIIKFIKKECLGENVVFTGMLLGEDKTTAYLESDVFVLPSYSENFGMAVAEAMSFGVPVIITKTVGIAPSVEKAGAGLVIDKDEKRLSEAILKILNNSGLAEKMGAAGKRLAATEFSWPEIAEKWIKEYNAVANNR